MNRLPIYATKDKFYGSSFHFNTEMSWEEYKRQKQHYLQKLANKPKRKKRVNGFVVYSLSGRRM